MSTQKPEQFRGGGIYKITQERFMHTHRRQNLKWKHCEIMKPKW